MTKFKKFYSVEGTNYSLMSFQDSLYLGIELTFNIPRKIGKPKKITQEFKVIELTPPLLQLFQFMVNGLEIDKEDKDFPEMTTYKRFKARDVINSIKDMYQESLENEISYIIDDFNKWCNNYREDNQDTMSNEDIEKVLNYNRNAVDKTIRQLMETNVINTLNFKKPKIVDSKDLYEFSMLENLQFLYSQKFNNNLTISYFYDLDVFGVITIYKVHTVKGYVKTVESFILNKEIINKLLDYVVSNKL